MHHNAECSHGIIGMHHDWPPSAATYGVKESTSSHGITADNGINHARIIEAATLRNLTRRAGRQGVDPAGVAALWNSGLACAVACWLRGLPRACQVGGARLSDSEEVGVRLVMVVQWTCTRRALDVH
jgi:hypothetical protein